MGTYRTCLGCRHLIFNPTTNPMIIGCRENHGQEYRVYSDKIVPTEQCIKLSNHVAKPKKKGEKKNEVQIFVDDPHILNKLAREELR